MPEILRDLSIIAILAHCLIMFMMLYESRFSRAKTYAALITLYVVAVTVMLLVVHFYGIQTAGRVMVLVCILPSLLLFLFMAKNRGARFLFTFCLVDTLMLVILILSRLFDALLGDTGAAMLLIRLLLPLLMEYLLVKYVRKPYLRLQRTAKKGWLAYSLLSVMFYLTILIDAFYPKIILERPGEIPQLVMFLLLLPVMYLTIFTALGRQLALLAGQERQHALELQIKLTGDRLKLWEEKERSLNILKHDLKHQVLLLDDYIKSGQYEKAQTYINALTEHIDKSTPKNFCQNRAANVVLSYYQSVAQEKGITLRAAVNLPEALRVDEIDLAVILSNALDNAIHALERCPDKTISVKGFTEADTLYLEVKNPFQDSVVFEDGIPLSKQEQHGYGTRSIVTIVERYGGIYSFSVEQGSFVFRCSM